MRGIFFFSGIRKGGMKLWGNFIFIKLKGISFKRLRISALAHNKLLESSEFLSENVLDRCAVNC